MTRYDVGGKEGGKKSGGRMGPAPLRGGWGRGVVPRLGVAHWRWVAGDQRGQRETFKGWGSEGNVARASPNCSGPSKPAGVLGLNPLTPVGLLLASWVPRPEPTPQPDPLPAKWVTGPKP